MAESRPAKDVIAPSKSLYVDGKRVSGCLRALDELVNREERGTEVDVAVAVGLAFDAHASLAL
jgi:hypothetical protein